MTQMTNRQYFLASRPAQMPTADNVQCRDVPLAPPGPGEVTLRNLYISLDPAIRGWMGDAPNYIEPIALGDAVRSSVIGRVVSSNSPDFAVGDVAMSVGAWEQYTTAPAAGLNKLDEAAVFPSACSWAPWAPPGSPPISVCWRSAVPAPVKRCW